MSLLLLLQEPREESERLPWPARSLGCGLHDARCCPLMQSSSLGPLSGLLRPGCDCPRLSCLSQPHTCAHTQVCACAPPGPASSSPGTWCPALNTLVGTICPQQVEPYSGQKQSTGGLGCLLSLRWRSSAGSGDQTSSHPH